MADFAHLHVHTHSSLLDGLGRPDDLAATAARDGQPAIASTDHGNLAVTHKMAQACRDHDLTFIPGIELYLAIGSRHERNVVHVPKEDDYDGGDAKGTETKEKRYEHLTVLATEPTGWRNLLHLDYRTRESIFYQPRADYDLLAEHAQGLVVGSGCLGGPVAGMLLRDDEAGARANLARLVDIYGHDNVFVEVMDHGIPAERKVIPGLTSLAREFDLPVVATNDAHYCHADDDTAHDVWLATKSRATLDSPNRFRFNGSGYHLKTTAQMHEMFDGQPGTENAVANTLLVAERVTTDLVASALPEPGEHLLPVVDVPPEHAGMSEYFHERIRTGLLDRYGSPLPQEVRERARMEEQTFTDFGMAAYMLTKADVIEAEQADGGLVGAGRGSAAGSIVAYALGVTNVDPLRYDLLFERFLNPERRSLPDIDTDFQASRQQTVIDRVARTYGSDRVARIGTVGVARSKDAAKKVARVLGTSRTGEDIARCVPDGDAKQFTLAGLLEPGNPEGSDLRRRAGEDEHVARVLDIATRVEGTPASESVHACGVVISPQPLPGMVPLRTDDGFPVTQWEADEVEAAGQVKFDFLAIKDLDVVADCVRLVEETTGEHIDVRSLSPDDEDTDRSQATWAMLAAGRTAGVFQVAGSGITELVRDIAPESLNDLSAILALYRPGPMGADMHTSYARRRRGVEPVDYGVYSPVAAEQDVIARSLGDTLGNIVYQEQLMSLARDVADFSGGQMKDLQKAFSKKKKDLMDPLREVWLTGGQASTRADGSEKLPFRESTLVNLWRTFEASSSYLFNRSHSVAYGMLTYVTAYLKANWPAHYGAALLLHTERDDKRQRMLADLHDEGVVVSPPNVNTGQVGTAVGPDGDVVLGLSEVAGVGQAAVDIVDERDRHGPFASMHDLVDRTKVPVGVLVALTEAGAMDDFGTRRGLAQLARAARVPDAVAPTSQWSVIETSTRQRARLGVVVGEHPMATLAESIRQWRTSDHWNVDEPLRQVHNLHALEHRQNVHVVGVIASVEEVNSKGRRRAHLVLESAKGRVEVVMWPREFAAYVRTNGRPPPMGRVVAVTGRLNVRDAVGDSDGAATITVYAEDLKVLDVDSGAKGSKPPEGAVMVISLPSRGAPAENAPARGPEPSPSEAQPRLSIVPDDPEEDSSSVDITIPLMGRGTNLDAELANSLHEWRKLKPDVESVEAAAVWFAERDLQAPCTSPWFDVPARGCRIRFQVTPDAGLASERAPIRRALAGATPRIA